MGRRRAGCPPALALFLLSGATAALVWMVLAARTERRHEIDADQLAARWGYPVTTAIAREVRATEPRLSQCRIYLPLRGHPLPPDRIHTAHNG